jgi:peptidoglycan/LPS O-acetylase OafA/YrhL
MAAEDGAPAAATETSPPAAAAVPARGPRLAPLDGMRAIFLAVVVAHHMVWAAPGYADDWVKGAWTGLDGFFVLSGFLIGGLLFSELAKTGRLRYGVFVLRRFLRLYPAMLVSIFAMGATAVWWDHQKFKDVWPTLRSGGLYLMNIPFGHDTDDYLSIAGHGRHAAIQYSHLWSLAVEFQFYLALPLLLLVLVKLRTPPWSWAAVIGVIMGIVWWHRTQVWTGPGSFPLAYVSTDTRIDTLLWGVLVALALRQGWIGERHRTALRILAPLALLWTVWVVIHVDSRDGFPYDWGMTLSGLAHSIMLAWIIVDGRTIVARIIGCKPLTYLGARSYSMYLYHFPLFFLISAHLTDLTSRQRVGVATLSLVLLGDLSYRLVERPAFKLKDRVGPGRVKPAAVPIEAAVIADARPSI